jgi:hypothetical protein
MGYTPEDEFIISPSSRYSNKIYPPGLIIVHHSDYFKALKSISSRSGIELEIQHHLDNVEDKGRGQYRYRVPFVAHVDGLSVPLMIHNSFDDPCSAVGETIVDIGGGARRIINIGSAGGIPPELKFGDIVIATSAIRDTGVDLAYATPDIEAKSDAELTQILAKVAVNTVTEKGVVWSVPTMYNKRSRLEELIDIHGNDLKVVETETASILTISQWANAVGFGAEQRENKLVRATALHYVSDILPKIGEPWIDTMNNAELLYPFKIAVLDLAIRTLVDAHKNLI